LRSESPTADRVQDQDDAVFMRSYIPRSLNEVYDPERDVARLKRGEGKDLIYGDLTGVVEANEEKTAVVKGEVVGGDVGDVSEEEESSEEEEESGEDGGSGYEDKKPRGKKHEDKESKKEHKKAVKEESREKRKHKMPKAEKKRKIKATRG